MQTLKTFIFRNSVIALLAIMAAFVLVSPTQTRAQSQMLSLKTLTGSDLVSLCQSKNSEDNTRCIGYIEGVIDYHILIRSLGTAPTVDFCIPQNTAMKDVVVKVVDYLHQYDLNDPYLATPGISLALFDAFPC